MIDHPTGPGASPPTITEAYGLGWSILRGRPLELLLVGIVWVVLSVPAGYLGQGVLGLAYDVLVLGPVNFGGMYAFLRAARGETPEVGDLFAAFRTDWTQAVLASLLVSVLVGIGTFLLIVPGVVAVVRLCWVPYLVVEGRRQAVAAVRESWDRTRPHAWTILGIMAAALGLVVLGLLLLIVGAFAAIMLAHVTAAAFYVAVVPRDEVVTPPAPTIG